MASAGVCYGYAMTNCFRVGVACAKQRIADRGHIGLDVGARCGVLQCYAESGRRRGACLFCGVDVNDLMLIEGEFWSRVYCEHRRAFLRGFICLLKGEFNIRREVSC